MRKREVAVVASSYKEAIEKAADVLEVPQSNIKLEEVEKGKYFASMVNADAEISLEFSEGGTSAKVKDYQPALGNGRTLSVKDFIDNLVRSGIAVDDEYSRDKLAISQGRQSDDYSFSLTEKIEKLSFEALGNLEYPVTIGAAFLKFKGGKDFSLGKGCRYDEEKKEVVSTTFGLVTVSEGKISVEPLFHTDKKQMKVYATIYVADFKDNSLDVEKYDRFLRDSGFTGNLEEKAIEEAIQQFWEGAEEQRNVIVMRGIPAEEGKNGMLVLEKEFRDLKKPVKVEKGTLLGKLKAPTFGKAGSDVLGKSISPRKGSLLSLCMGSNISVSNDGNQFFASSEGMLLFTHKTLSVVEVIEQEESIDGTTAEDLYVEEGSLRVKGSILNGAQVNCEKGHIIIEKCMKEGVVEAFGDISVEDGIDMEGQGSLKAGGNIFSTYCRRSKIHAEGDIHIQSDLTDSYVISQGSVVCVEGEGKIVGGEIQAKSRIEANEIGSKAGAVTKISIDLRSRGHKIMLEEKEELSQKNKKVTEFFMSEEFISAMRSISVSGLDNITKLARVRTYARKRSLEIDEMLMDMERKIAFESRGNVIAYKVIHPNTVVTISGVSLTVDEPISHCRLFLDAKTNKIRSEELSFSR